MNFCLKNWRLQTFVNLTFHIRQRQYTIEWINVIYRTTTNSSCIKCKISNFLNELIGIFLKKETLKWFDIYPNTYTYTAFKISAKHTSKQSTTKTTKAFISFPATNNQLFSGIPAFFAQKNFRNVSFIIKSKQKQIEQQWGKVRGH